MVVQLSAAFAALCFGALVYYLVRTLRSVDMTLNRANRLIDDASGQLRDWNAEVQRIVRTSEHIAADALHKLHTLNPLFDSVQDVGSALHDVTSSLKQVSAAAASAVNRTVRHADEPLEPSGKWARGLDWVAATIRMLK